VSQDTNENERLAREFQRLVDKLGPEETQRRLSAIAAEVGRMTDAKELRNSLVTAALFIASYEVLEDLVIDETRTFITLGLQSKDRKEMYESEVLDLSPERSKLDGSLRFLKDVRAIDNDDISTFRRIRDIRNRAVHNLLGFACASDRASYRDDLNRMIKLIEKLDRWWIAEVEISGNPAFVGKEIDLSSVASGRVLMLKGLLHLALSNQEVSDFELNKSVGE
jgi:hypothetical protein